MRLIAWLKTLDWQPYMLGTVLFSVLSLSLLTVKYDLIRFNQYRELIQVLVWPLTALFVVLFFRKVVSYLVLSLETFNFFGAGGRLKSPLDVIEEKIKERKEREERDKRLSEFEAIVLPINEKLLNEKEDLISIIKNAITDVRSLLTDNDSLRNERDVLKEELGKYVWEEKKRNAMAAVMKELRNPSSKNEA